jgi:hypothetical protein
MHQKYEGIEDLQEGIQRKSSLFFFYVKLSLRFFNDVV